MDFELKKLNMKSPIEPRRKGVRRKKRWWILGISVLIIGLFVWFMTHSSGQQVFQFAMSAAGGPTIKSTDDRVNVLLLGLAGGKHDGATLTDSIIIASYHMKSNKVTMISVPRDLWLEGIKEKVNAAYQEGEERPEGGLAFASDKIDDIIGVPIHYAVRIDFAGFAKAIDLVEGIDVDVPKTFDDYNYPITGKEEDLCGLVEKEMDISEEMAKNLKLKSGKQKLLVDSSDKIATEAADFSCRFEKLHFTKGVTHMDGETALKFVRSRMGTNGEGSDFARSRRQQLVIQAFRDKALSLNTLFNPSKIGGLLNTFGQSVDTNIPKDDYLEFYNIAKNIKGVSTIVLGDLGDGKSVLIVGDASKYGRFVMVPPNEDFSPLQQYIKTKLDEAAIEATPSAQPK
jgi:LCP family protein required for cell wall assembly